MNSRNTFLAWEFSIAASETAIPKSESKNAIHAAKS